MSKLQTLDSFQKRHRTAAVTVAAAKKFSDDQSSNLAAMIAFWAFFSIFPLLMVMVTILGWVLPESDKQNVLGHVASMFPLLDPKTITGLSGSVWALLIGGLTSLWSGLGVVRTVQTAFDAVWDIPAAQRPGIVEQVLRSLKVLGTVGLGLVLSTLLSSVITGSSTGLHLGVVGHLAGFVVAIALDVGLFIAAFRMLTSRDVSTRDVLPGAVFSGVVFFVLEELSSLIISTHLQSSQSTYGHFATVITILWWFYLQSLVTLLGAQINVVLKRRLFPRSLTASTGGAPQRAKSSTSPTAPT